MTIGLNIKRTSSYFIAFMIIVNLISFNSNSQSLTEKLGGVKTDFVFISDSIEMDIIDQIILKRGVKDSNTSYGSYSDGAYGYGYGYGFETFHLEFITTSKIKEIKFYERKKWTHYKIDLMAENDSLLYSFKKYPSDVVKVLNGDSLQTYSINLYKVPMIFLDRTKKIRIEYSFYKSRF